MHELIRYISPYNPTFGSEIRGASTEEIRLLQKAAGRALPFAYRTFLLSMGHGTGGLPLAFDASTDISDTTSYYTELGGARNADFPEQYLLIGCMGNAVEETYISSSEEAPGTQVFHTGFDLNTPYAPYARSLRGLLFRLAFHRYRITAFPHAVEYSSVRRHPIVNKAANAARNLGFTALWFSDEISYCGEREDLALTINQFYADSPLMVLAGEHAQECKTVGKRLAKELDLKKI